MKAETEKVHPKVRLSGRCMWFCRIRLGGFCTYSLHTPITCFCYLPGTSSVAYTSSSHNVRTLLPSPIICMVSIRPVAMG